GAALSTDGQVIALGCGGITPQWKTWWSWFTDLVGIKDDPSGSFVTLNTFSSGEEIIALANCSSPVISPTGSILAVHANGNWELWDLPIRKPIGKILGLAGLAAVATLLSFNGLGWLRRRRIKRAVTPASQ